MIYEARSSISNTAVDAVTRQNRDSQNRDSQNRDSQNRERPFRDSQNRDSQNGGRQNPKRHFYITPHEEGWYENAGFDCPGFDREPESYIYIGGAECEAAQYFRNPEAKIITDQPHILDIKAKLTFRLSVDRYFSISPCDKNHNFWKCLDLLLWP